MLHTGLKRESKSKQEYNKIKGTYTFTEKETITAKNQSQKNKHYLAKIYEYPVYSMYTQKSRKKCSVVIYSWLPPIGFNFWQSHVSKCLSIEFLPHVRILVLSIYVEEIEI